MKRKHLLDDEDPISDYLQNLYRHFVDSQSWMHDIFREDDADFLGIPPSGKSTKYDSHRDWIKSVYGLNHSKTEDWKDVSHVGGLKLRSKYNALVSHLMSDILKDGKISASLRHTPESDIEELFNKGMVEMSDLVTDEMRQNLVLESDKRLEKAESILLDNKQESRAEATYYQVLRDYAKYGVCALETVVREDKKIRNYAPQIIETPDGQGFEMIPTAGFKETFYLKAERISPYDIFLDPEASGDAQKGVGVFKRQKLDLEQLSELRKRSRYDSKTIASIIDEFIASNNYNYGSGTTASDGTDEISSTKPFLAITFWGNLTKKDLEEWKKSNPLVKKLIDELKTSDDVDYTDKYASFPCQAVLVDDKLVYLSPLLTANQKRPIAYDRMIPVEDTNYGMGVFALGREPSRVMSKIWSRALNNETIVGSAMFSYDPEFIDESTLIFKPGGKVRRKAGSSALLSKTSSGDTIQQINFQSVSQSLLVLFDKLDLLLDELTMIPRNLIGVTDTSRRTATEVSTNLSSAQVILLNIRRSFDKNIIEVDLEHTYHYLQNDESTPQDALADAFVTVFGAETFALKVINKQMVQELLQIIPSLSQVSPELLTSFNWTNLTSDILEGLGFDKTKFLNVPELKTQLESANQQIQQLVMQLEQMQKQGEEFGKQVEQLTNENNDLKLKNHQISSQGKVEAKLNLQELENKQLKDEIKRLKESLSQVKKESSRST